MMREFLPISRDDMKKRGWDELDFVYVIGDAYVDHPSFGPAIISIFADRFMVKASLFERSTFVYGY